MSALPKQGTYFAFLSSLTRDEHSKLVQQWRRKMQVIGKDTHPIWVAEICAPELPSQTQGAILHRLRAAVAASQRVFCVLTPRMAADDFGERICLPEFHDASCCSFVEMELLFAITLRKPIHLFYTKDFRPGPRLAAFLDFIRLDLPKEQVHGDLNSLDDLLKRTEELISQHSRGQLIDAPPLPSSLFFNKLWALRTPDEYMVQRDEYVAPHYLAEKSRLFAPRLNLDLVDRLLLTARGQQRHDDRLMTLWQARRELGAWPVTHQSIPRDPMVQARLTEVLSVWASSAAWFGLHGHTRLGQLEALAELRVLSLQRSQHAGGISSAYYSAALLMSGAARRDAFRAALAHSFIAESEEPENIGILAVRASIFMRQRKFWQARTLYRQVLQSRECGEVTKSDSIGEAKCELALAEAICFSPWRALGLARSGVAMIPEHSDFKPRALRKLALILRLHGKFGDARMAMKECAAIEAARGRETLDG